VVVFTTSALVAIKEGTPLRMWGMEKMEARSTGSYKILGAPTGESEVFSGS
jgi:hypothetical protein